MRLCFDNPEWKKVATKCGLKAAEMRSVNTIIRDIAQAIGIHGHENTTLLGRPLPFNYYDCCLLSVNETAHQRMIGIMGSIFNCIHSLIPDWLRDERLEFFKHVERSRGFSALLNVTTDLKGKDPKVSRKAVRIWASCMCLLGDASLYGIHPDVINFFREQLMLLGRWFSPAFDLYEHFNLRSIWVDHEEKLDLWRKQRLDGRNTNEQLKAIADSLWNTYNAKNALIGWDVHVYPWGNAKSLFGLGYESFHKVDNSFLFIFFC